MEERPGPTAIELVSTGAVAAFCIAAGVGGGYWIAAATGGGAAVTFAGLGVGMGAAVAATWVKIKRYL